MQDFVKNALGMASDRPIPSPIIKRGLDNVLDVLGICLMNAVFEDMWNSGIVFGRNTAYSIDEIHIYFERVLGKHVADLLIKQLKKELAAI